MRRVSKLTLGILFCVLLVGLLGACSSSGSDIMVGDNHSSETEHHESLVRSTKPDYVFGLIYPMAHPFYEMLTGLAEEAAKTYNAQLIVKAPEEYNPVQLTQIMETMIKQNVNAIGIDAVDAQALGPVIQKAVQAGIPVVCVGSDAAINERSTFIGSDPSQAGTLMGEALNRLLKGRGMVLIAAGSSSNREQLERTGSLLEYLRDHTDIQVLDVRYNEGSPDRSLKDLKEMSDKHPHFDTMVTMDILSTSQAILVWKAMGLNRSVVALGYTPAYEEALRNGQVTILVTQNEQQWGDYILDGLVKAVKGQAQPSWRDTGLTVMEGAAAP